MARRKTPRGAIWHPDIVRQKIRTSQLINRLHSHIFGTLPLTMTQLYAINILLKKCLPDLTTTTVVADVNVRYVAHLPEPISREAWLEKYGGDYLDPAHTIEGTVNGSDEDGKAGTLQ